VKTVNLNGHDILRCQEKHKPMNSAASLPLCYRRAAAKILREIILLTELAHDNIVKVREASRSLLPTSRPQVTAGDGLCGVVVRVPGYRSRCPGLIPGATRFSEK
jgi:hypothetical protein